MITLRRRQLILLALPLVAVLVLAGQRLTVGSTDAARSSRPAELVDVGAVGSGAGTDQPQVVVHVSGAVLRPGLYRLPEGARVADAVTKAGGLKPRADLSVLNLAAPMIDGQHVVVPRRIAPGAGGVPPSDASTSIVQLSSASVDQLDELPGIGPITAQKIVDWRQTHGAFRSVDDLDAIPGIGPTRVEQLRELVVP
jgi:competence protein ComEA